MPELSLVIAEAAAETLRGTIRAAGGAEVFFFGRVAWTPDGQAMLVEAEPFARGNAWSTPALIEGAEAWDLAIHNHPSGRLEPSDADVGVAGLLGHRGVGFAIIDNDATRACVVVSPLRREAPRRIDAAEIESIFGPDGPFARALDGYEPRRGQIEMALEVASALNDDRVVACEAGTGIGKSFAYLVPSILWASRNRERVVVSTGTIALQEQLVRKDLPFLRQVLPTEFRFSLMKGRGNYACRRKVAELATDLAGDLPLAEHEGEREQLRSLVEWAESSTDGSLADLSWSPNGAVWEKVMSETDRSLKVRCPHYSECFYYRARREMAGAQIVVANHHLFLSDLAVRRQTGNFEHDWILPGYSRVVFDEAHHLEDVASEHLGLRFSRAGVRMRLSRMHAREGQRGSIPLLAKRLREQNDAASALRIEERYARPFLEIARELELRFDELEEFLEESLAPGSSDGGGPSKVRYRGAVEEEPFWERVREHIGRVREELERVLRLNARALVVVSESSVSEDSRRTFALDLTAFANRLEAFLLAITTFVDVTDATRVRWIDTNTAGSEGRRGSIGFHAAPISVASDLRDSLFSRVKTVALASATLSVADRPNFLADRLGFSDLPQERFRFRQHRSPFRYREQARLLIPTDLPEPTSHRFDAELPGIVFDLVRASRGRAFVLFTSYRLLRATFDRLRGPIEKLGYLPLAQGEAQRSTLLDEFSRVGGGVLFGTDSFWEGVDVRGAALSHVILTRLPFRVPTEPLQEARIDAITAAGKNAFREYTVPQAVLRFKQGFGRLIRSTRDRGVVTVLDRRILTKPYGKTFLRSLPELDLICASRATLIPRIEEFLAAAEATRAAEDAAELAAVERLAHERGR